MNNNGEETLVALEKGDFESFLSDNGIEQVGNIKYNEDKDFLFVEDKNRNFLAMVPLASLDKKVLHRILMEHLGPDPDSTDMTIRDNYYLFDEPSFGGKPFSLFWEENALDLFSKEELITYIINLNPHLWHIDNPRFSMLKLSKEAEKFKKEKLKEILGVKKISKKGLPKWKM